MITKEQFESLYSDDITKKQYDAIIELIDERFGEICSKFLVNKNANFWFSYGNASWDDQDDEGYFDPEEYRENIRIGCDCDCTNPPAGYDYEFPTRWLWEENWQEEMQKVSKEYTEALELKKKKAKEKKETRKKEVEALKASIKSKLTPKELKIVKFTGK
jgi:hypothetical protein